MAILYDKNGKSFNVPHTVDVKDWLATGDYSETKPTGAKSNKPTKPNAKPNLLDKA